VARPRPQGGPHCQSDLLRRRHGARAIQRLNRIIVQHRSVLPATSPACDAGRRPTLRAGMPRLGREGGDEPGPHPAVDGPADDLMMPCDSTSGDRLGCETTAIPTRARHLAAKGPAMVALTLLWPDERGLSDRLGHDVIRLGLPAARRRRGRRAGCRRAARADHGATGRARSARPGAARARRRRSAGVGAWKEPAP
jgi:hypothetical protein